jgi:hypothetical protein
VRYLKELTVHAGRLVLYSLGLIGGLYLLGIMVPLLVLLAVLVGLARVADYLTRNVNPSPTTETASVLMLNETPSYTLIHQSGQDQPYTLHASPAQDVTN